MVGMQVNKQAAVRLSEDTFNRLQILAKRTGRTATYYIREAIEEHLENLEDIYLSEKALENLAKGKDSILDSKDFWNDLDD
jgi:RHH-type rel operon transcriptional repressor/antitoxin RelB